MHNGKTITLLVLVSLGLGAHAVNGMDYQGMDKPDHKVMTVQKEMKEMDKKMMDAMGDKDKMYDKRFMELMISHHEGGIKMAKDAINNSERSEIKDMAKKIIETQKKEINQMEGWKKSWYQE